MKKLIYFIGILIIYNVSFAQHGLLSGTLIDETSNKPIAAKVTFVGNEGSINKVKSNSLDGIFQIVVKPNTEYNIIVEKYLISGENSVFSAPFFSDYTEFNKTFKMKKIEVGMKLAEFNSFDPNKTKINEQNQSNFKFLSEFIKQQIGTNVEIIISSSDSQFKSTTRTEEQIVKGKKKKVKIKVSESDLASELIKSRIEAIKLVLKDYKIAEKNITFTEKVELIKPIKNKKVKSKSKDKTEEINPSNLKYDTEFKIAKVSSL